ncbi:MAG TPA: hypothetical protein VIJ14_05515, partial [Rhabdochlamydiaceae bacterium]
MALTHMNKRILADCRHSGKAAAPLTVPLFGHIIDAAYVEPANDHWQDAVQAGPVADDNNNDDDDNNDDELTVSVVRGNEDIRPEVAEESVSVSLPRVAIAALQRIQGDQGPSRLAKRTRPVDSDSDYQPEVSLQRRRRQPEGHFPPPPQVHQEIPSPASQRQSVPLSTPPRPRKRVAQVGQSSTVSSLPSFSQLVSMVRALQDQIQTMQSTISTQQARITLLEVQVEDLRNASTVPGENESVHDDEDEEDEDDEEVNENDDDSDGDDDGDGASGGSGNVGNRDDMDEDDDNIDLPPLDMSQYEPFHAEPLNAIPFQEAGSLAIVVYAPPPSFEESFDIMDSINFDIHPEEVVNEIEYLVEDEVLDEDDQEVDEIETLKDQAATVHYISSTGTEFPENLFDDDNTPLQAEEAEPNSERSNLKASWFKSLPPKPKAKASYDVSEACKGMIISWKYDEKLKLIVVKRSDGVQYFQANFSALSSLPKCEVIRLSKLNIINRSNDDLGYQIERLLRKEVRGKFDLLKPATGKRMIFYKKIDPRTNKPWIKLVYPPVRSLTQVPLIQYQQNFLENLKWWYYDGTTGEAVLEDKEKGIVLYVYDPINLINFSASDLKILHKNKILYDQDEEIYARSFQRVVDCCVSKGVHAGSQLPAKWKEA